MVTRRSALLAGVALLAGCGKEDAENAPPGPASGVRGAAARAGRHARRRGRVRRRDRAPFAGARHVELAALVSAAGGRPHDAPAPEGGGDAAAAQRAALEALIAALPSLTDDARGPRPR